MLFQNDLKLHNLKPFELMECEIDKKSILISRTGYTGEDGYEIYCGKNSVHLIWDLLFENGKFFGHISDEYTWSLSLYVNF